jgi:predicted metal-binding protein
MHQPVTIHVCVTCRDAATPDGAERPGARLLRFLEDAAAEGAGPIEIVPVECLSVCKRPCTIGFSAPGKWTYVYGDLAPETSAETIMAGAALYAQAPDGIIPWKQRPDALKKGVVARIPPLPIRAAAAES